MNKNQKLAMELNDCCFSLSDSQ